MKESKLKNVLRVILFPLLFVRKHIIIARDKRLAKTNPQKLAGLLYKSVMHKDMDWDNPQDLNAKIQWLKFYGDQDLWILCADKYRVRSYIEEKGFGNMLVDLYGVWNNVEDIDWESLPNKFVMKMNNDSGGIYICKDKASFDIETTKQLLNYKLHSTYSDLFVEPHYCKIKPCIIAEQLLDSDNQDMNSASLIDYKVWCFDGEPLYIIVYYDRTEGHAKFSAYDTKWNYSPNICAPNKVFGVPKDVVPKPSCLDEMLHAASILSKGHPQVRVDFYVVGGKCYFGEMTFTSCGGYMGYFTEEALLEMGAKTNLKLSPKKS